MSASSLSLPRWAQQPVAVVAGAAVAAAAAAALVRALWPAAPEPRRREGGAEAMIQAIGTQPLHIRGKALVDPMEIQRDLLKRTAQVSEKFGKLLPETVATEHATVQTSFLETCLRITNS